MPLSQDLLPGVPLVESPLFDRSVGELGLTESELSIAKQLHDRGYAVFNFPDVDIEQRIDRIKQRLAANFPVALDDPSSLKSGIADLRVQDAWTFDDDVREIAANEHVLDLLSKLYGRRAFPFQTLNFPVGTQQNLHSDSIHFSSIPERFMCGVWLAFEDISQDAGPLLYLPGSHKWPILSNVAIGRLGADNRGGQAQDPFQAAWDALVEASDIECERFLPRKGQAPIWAANLLHGGDRQNNPTLTRWSQVTHYYFEDCIYYTPAFSDEALGRLELRTITNVLTGEVEPNRSLGEEVSPALQGGAPKLRRTWPFSRGRKIDMTDLPEDFDARTYYRLNPDVAAVGQEAAQHYLLHGRSEGRRYKIR